MIMLFKLFFQYLGFHDSNLLKKWHYYLLHQESLYHIDSSIRAVLCIEPCFAVPSVLVGPTRSDTTRHDTTRHDRMKPNRTLFSRTVVGEEL